MRPWSLVPVGLFGLVACAGLGIVLASLHGPVQASNDAVRPAPVALMWGPDLAQAVSSGFVTEAASSPAGVEMSLHGLPGGVVRIDRLLVLHVASETGAVLFRDAPPAEKQAAVTWRAWSGEPAPTTNDGPGVCATWNGRSGSDEALSCPAGTWQLQVEIDARGAGSDHEVARPVHLGLVAA